MTNNTVIRLVTFAVIVFCFFAMFLTATLSTGIDFRYADPASGPVEISGSAVQTGSQLSMLSAEEPAAEEAPSM